jgi:hypothetical protein
MIGGYSPPCWRKFKGGRVHCNALISLGKTQLNPLCAKGAERVVEQSVDRVSSLCCKCRAHAIIPKSSML